MMAGIRLANRLGILTLVLAGLAVPAMPAEPIERELLHEGAVFVMEIQRPLDWADHPLIQRVWEPVSKSRQLGAGMETPEFGRVLAARDFLESAMGRSWQESLADLTSGGIWFAATPKPAERITLVVSAKDADSWKRLETAAAETIKTQKGNLPPSKIYRGIRGYRAGDAHLAFADRRLLLASKEADLKRMVDHLLDESKPESHGEANASSRPSVRFSVNLTTVRQAPDFQKALARPSDDAGQIAILGGWADLLRAAEDLELDLSWPAESEQIQLKLNAKSAGSDDVLSGFFASGPNDQIAPLLKPEGVVYSASWFRDYAALWNNRAELLTESALGKMEKGDADVKQQFSVFGVSFTPSELFKQLGTEFRVVLARSPGSDYRVELKNQLPAAAVCISLRDEKAFLTQADPLSRALGLVAAFGEAKMLSKTSEHAQAQLKGLWFRDDDKAIRQGNQLRYNFSPTWTVAREHFILGSTRKVVTQVIDELDRQAAELESAAVSSFGLAGVTERQLLDFSQFASGLMDFREAILEGSVLERGLTFADSIKELDLAKDAIHSLGQLTTEAAFTEKGFEYHLRLGPESPSQESKR